MQGDFSRNTFDTLNHYSRVLMQQGRVQIDADWNEQTSVLLHYVQTLTRDLLGPHGGPIENCGFEVAISGDQLIDDELEPIKNKLDSHNRQRDDFLIKKGRYYVDGLLCENDEAVWYSTQPLMPLSPPLNLAKDSPYLVYLDVWEQHVSAIDNHSIREVALDGADTTTRAKIMWQVRTYSELKTFFPAPENSPARIIPEWREVAETWQPKNRGSLKVRPSQAETSTSSDSSPAASSPEPTYRGLDNQLYRIEVHRGGSVSNATFKWSRENGSVLFSIEKQPEGGIVSLSDSWANDRGVLRRGDWVEILGDGHVFTKNQEPHPLLQITQIDSNGRRVTTDPPFTASTEHVKQLSLRRWDHKAGDPKRGGSSLLDGTARIQEGEGSQDWLSIEHGIEIQFQKTVPAAQYRSGDYWLIPARTATSSVEWLQREKGVPPHGVHHHYAPLAVISISSNTLIVDDFRKVFEGISRDSKRKNP